MTSSVESSLTKIKFFIKTTGDYKTRDNEYINYSNIINKDTIYLLTEFDLSKNRYILDLYMKNVLPEKNKIDIFTSYENFNNIKKYRKELYAKLTEEIIKLEDDKEVNFKNRKKLEILIREKNKNVDNEQLRSLEKLQESIEFIDEKLLSLKKEIDEMKKNLIKIENVDLLKNQKQIYEKKINLILDQRIFDVDQRAIPYDKIIVFQLELKIQEIENNLFRLRQTRTRYRDEEYNYKQQNYNDQINDEKEKIPSNVVLSPKDRSILTKLYQTNKLDRLMTLKKLEEKLKEVEIKIQKKIANEPPVSVEQITRDNIEFLKDNLFPSEKLFDGSKNIISKKVITMPRNNKKFIITSSTIIDVKDVDTLAISNSNYYYEYVKYIPQQKKDTHRSYVESQTTYIVFIKLEQLKEYNQFKMEQKFLRIKNQDILNKLKKEYQQTYDSSNTLKSDVVEFITLGCKEKEAFLNNQAESLNLPFSLSLYDAADATDADAADATEKSYREKFLLTFKEIKKIYHIKDTTDLKNYLSAIGYKNKVDTSAIKMYLDAENNKYLNAVQLKVDEYNIRHEDEIEQLEEQIKQQDLAKLNEEENRIKQEKEKKVAELLQGQVQGQVQGSNYDRNRGGKRNKKNKTIKKLKRKRRTHGLLKKRNQTRTRK